MNSSQVSHRPIRSILDTLDVRGVAIVDDKFDPPSPSNKIDQSILELIQGGDEEIIAELAREAEVPAGELIRKAHFEEPIVTRFWEFARTSDTRAAVALKYEVFLSSFEDLDRLKTLTDVLEASGAKVQPLGPSQPRQPNQLETAELWFFDLYWSESVDDDAWIESAKRAREEYHHAEGIDVPPIFVLMSRDEERMREKKQEFRDIARVPDRYFLTLPKKLLEGDDVGEELAAWFKREVEPKKLNFRRKVHGLTRAIARAADDALKKYDSALSEFSAEDYVHIYQSNVGNKETPFGTHMLWLFEPLFEHYVKQDERVRRSKDDLDRLSVDDLPALESDETAPSETLSEIFAARVWQEVAEKDRTGFTVGDLVSEVSEHERVFIIAHHSDTGSVQLIKGQIVPRPAGRYYTPYFEIHQKSGPAMYSTRYISWDTEELVHKTASDLQKRYMCKWRLRQPYLDKLIEEQKATRS